MSEISYPGRWLNSDEKHILIDNLLRLEHMEYLSFNGKVISVLCQNFKLSVYRYSESDYAINIAVLNNDERTIKYIELSELSFDRVLIYFSENCWRIYHEIIARFTQSQLKEIDFDNPCLHI